MKQIIFLVVFLSSLALCARVSVSVDSFEFSSLRRDVDSRVEEAQWQRGTIINQNDENRWCGSKEGMSE